MKKTFLMVLMIIVLGLSGCSKSYDYDEESPYFSYLGEDNPRVSIEVEGYGIILLELFPEVAPITVDNFIAYVNDDAYSGSTFHRVIDDFMVQGGRVSNAECPIYGEFDNNGYDNPLNHYAGTIAMARTNIKNSATSQFFINEVYNDFLNDNYAAFGGVIEGFEIVQEISEVLTNSSDVPMKTITINSITIDLNGYEPGDRVCR
jgi:peptidyl-prolyl cis-trans isomerase B (cyclophilin B)